jgi:predicted NAD/FAD-dependent oxidoreductase
MSMKCQTIVVGAGLAGLQFVSRSNFSTKLLEKSGGVLGRISSRTINKESFMKGASFIDINHVDFSNFVKGFPVQMNETGVIVTNSFRESLKEFYGEIDIHKKVRVLNIKKLDHVLHLSVLDEASGDSYQLECDNLVMTGPVPQMLELFGEINKEELQSLNQIRYEKKGVVCLVEQEEIQQISEDERFLLVSQNQAGNVYVLKEEICNSLGIDSKDRLETFVKDLLGLDQIDPSSCHIHYWKYSNCMNPLDMNYFNLKDCIYFIGDSFANGGAQGAWLSAQALAENLNQRFGESK